MDCNGFRQEVPHVVAGMKYFTMTATSRRPGTGIALHFYWRISIQSFSSIFRAASNALNTLQCNKPKSLLSFFTGLLLGYLKQLFLTPHLVRSCLNRQAKSPTLPKIPGLIPLSMGAAFGCDDPWFLKELVNRPWKNNYMLSNDDDGDCVDGGHGETLILLSELRWQKHFSVEKTELP
ncbi:hypothetical protein CEXT_802231 [Caerostris extrusa]|uniref:Uncharacterized protein n=1 Tax=Caerostris extrusa TaxID=172846 RepID=A0AAV4NXF9_CAEEX|nr:hypothetical protein CEXT_802231 [Caerostris extrusa]